MSSQTMDIQKLLSMPLDDIVKMNDDKQKHNQPYNNKQYSKYSQHNYHRKGIYNRHYTHSDTTNNNKPFNKFGNFQHKTFKKLSTNKQPSNPSRLLITNLHKEIIDSELEQIFSRIGKLKRCAVHVDEKGNSLGSADVEYVLPEDAKRAMEFFKKTEINRVFMKIEYDTRGMNNRFQNKRRIGKFRKVFKKNEMFRKRN